MFDEKSLKKDFTIDKYISYQLVVSDMVTRKILFIIVLAFLEAVLLAFLFTFISEKSNFQADSSFSFVTKTIIVPPTEKSSTPLLNLNPEKEQGNSGWSSRPKREESDEEDNTDEEIPPCPDANNNGICGHDEISEDQNTTLQMPPPNFKVAFIGDSGHGSNYRQVLELIRNEGTDMVIHAGDLGYDEGNAESAQLWLDQIESILDPTAPDGVFPYFFSMGNHDVGHWNNEKGYQRILADRFNRLGVIYTGDPAFLGAKTSFVYNGIAVVLTAPGENQEAAGDNHAAFIQQQLQDNTVLWDICTWHKNQRAMQVGGKGDEAGWEVYETCREQGAIIATAHEHSYGRTQVLSDMSEQIIADDISPYIIQPGQTFAFHSALGGQSIRSQRSDIEELDYFASVYTANQNATPGALFIEFNVDDNPRKAHGYFKNINGEIIDEFDIHNNAPEPETDGEEETSISPVGFVHAEGTELRLDGEPYQFIGFNVYGLANDRAISTIPPISFCGPSARNGENPDEYLQALFSNLSSHGINVIRFWAFQSFTNGGTDFSSFDRVLHYAELYNMKMIPVLENHWDDCTEGGEKTSGWYTDGYTQPYGNYALSYRQYVEEIITRYQNEPAILMWQLMNEAESEDADALYNFTVDVSELIQSIDHNHLVSLGTLGTGQAGTQNENFVRLHEMDTVDVVEAHDYGHESEPWPNDDFNSIDSDFEVAQTLNKPFFIGEAGISMDRDTSEQQRANLFDDKIQAAFNRAVAGYLIWQWDNSEENFGDGCSGGYCVTEGDPVLDVMENYS